jgi:hypothetical protein
MRKVAKNGRKVKAIALLFAVFCLFMKMKKVAKNGLIKNSTKVDF